jgi:alkanesulfonate monooxygenase SsuD/methylene tetrahydromethanopterin reductase-like flavin-dependent oxidoreductase (luciferase family)
MNSVDFAWVFQPAARADEDGSELLSNNYRFIEHINPYIQDIWIEDHFQWDARPVIECWSTLCFLAGKYPDLRLSPLVLGQSYRNPALVAKMAATVHYLTGGRMIFGIGAGWKQDEYRAFGWEFPAASMRIEQLEEAVQIIKAMWTQTPATFEGKHYRIHDAYCEPKPSPLPPIMIGGGGERFTLPVVARHADWWNIPFCTAEEYQHKQASLQIHCNTAGRDYTSIRKTYFGFCSISNDPSRLISREGLHVIKGSPDEVAGELQSLVDLGVDYFILRFLDFPQTEGVDLFLEHILPRFR